MTRLPAATAALQLLLLLLGCSCRACWGLAIVGYVPDYRFKSVDWDGIVRSVTHLVIFSLEPAADGAIDGLNRLRGPLPALAMALARAEEEGEERPRVLVALGGAGRSAKFAQVASNKRARKRFAREVANFLEEQKVFSGVDLDWEVPESPHHWRDFGKLAQELRTALGTSEQLARRGAPLLTMTYHPLSGAVPIFSALRGKKSEVSFVDLFDLCHAMTYSRYDHEKRHSSLKLDASAVDEWTKYGLPLERLTLGLAFFGVNRRTGESLAYRDILAREPSLQQRPEVDESKAGDYFVNAGSARKKVQFAARHGLAGVMIWELGQDAAASSEGCLLRHVRDAASEAGGLWRKLLAWIPFSEDHILEALTTLLGLYYLQKVIRGEAPGLKLAPRRASAGQSTEQNSPEHAAGPVEQSAAGDSVSEATAGAD